MSGPAVLRFSRGLPPTKQFGERLRLLVRQGQDQGTCYSLLGDLLFIGREDCQIVLNDTNISRKHAELSWKEDHYVIRDLGSANGIVHNGTKTAEAKLNPGDIVLMGLTVLEVYPSGQTRRNERPQLPGPVRRLAAVPAPVPEPAPAENAGPAQPQKSAKEIKEEKKKVERKRMIIIVVLFFLLATAYFNDQQETMRSHTKIQQAEDIDPPQDKGRLGDREQKEIDKLAEKIRKTKEALVRDQARRAVLEERLKTTKNLTSQAMLEEEISSADKQQRKDAEIFFRSGVREMQNKNYRRAFTAFDTALTVEPNHELAKIYLKSAKMELLSELWSTQVAGLRAKSSLRYKEGRMHFENILRYLDDGSGVFNSMDNEANKELRELYADAKKELDELDKLEKRIK